MVMQPCRVARRPPDRPCSRADRPSTAPLPFLGRPARAEATPNSNLGPTKSAFP